MSRLYHWNVSAPVPRRSTVAFSVARQLDLPAERAQVPILVVASALVLVLVLLLVLALSQSRESDAWPVVM